MKKLITLAATCLSLGALAACGKGGEPKETKTEWTDEEKAIISGDDGVLNFELPFYQAKLEVSTDTDDGLLLIKSGRKCSSEDVEAYVALLDDADYTEFDSAYGEECGTDILDLVSFKDDEFELRNKNYNGLVINDAVAVGLDEEDHLLIAATVYLSMFDGNAGYPAQYVDYFCEHIESWLANFGYEANSIPFPSTTYFELSGDSAMIGVFEYTYIYPFTYGNLYSEDFMLVYDLVLQGATEEAYNDYFAAVNAAVELSLSQGSYVGTIQSDAGTSIVMLSAYNSQHSAFSFSIGFLPAEDAE